MQLSVRLSAAVCCLLAFLQAAAAQAEKRVALVIGNAAYRAVAELPNARKDARDIAAALKAAGFGEVVEHYDLGIREMQQALAAFEDKATGADWAVVYYAGHGIEVDGRNFMVPIDAQLKRASDVEDETLPLDRVLARVAASRKLQLVILDACRHNPFKARMAVGGAGVRAIGERGLARVEPKHPNVLVAYAAREGEVALDGEAGGNSPYAKALAKHLAEPGLEVGTLFRKVRDDVMAETGGKQRPFEYGSLSGQQLYFRPASGATATAVTLPAAASPAVETARICREVEGMSSPATLKVLERLHKGTPAGECVAARLAELAVVLQPKAAEATAVGAFNPLRADAPLTAAEERALKPGDSFKECAECPEMVVVPAGSFMLGEKGRDADTGPQQQMTIAKPFAVGRLEVKAGEWKACMTAGQCTNPLYAGSTLKDDAESVHYVSWEQITSGYLLWLSRRTGKTYRLPSEAEWEHAARAGKTIVDASEPNGFGLYGMHGSVWEWVQDCWNKNHAGAPSDGSAWTTGECGYRVLRHGSARHYGLRAAQRERHGFRIARPLDQ